jgi:hypothetical protein
VKANAPRDSTPPGLGTQAPDTADHVPSLLQLAVGSPAVPAVQHGWHCAVHVPPTAVPAQSPGVGQKLSVGGWAVMAGHVVAAAVIRGRAKHHKVGACAPIGVGWLVGWLVGACSCPHNPGLDMAWA